VTRTFCTSLRRTDTTFLCSMQRCLACSARSDEDHTNLQSANQGTDQANCSCNNSVRAAGVYSRMLAPWRQRGSAGTSAEPGHALTIITSRDRCAHCVKELGKSITPTHMQPSSPGPSVSSVSKRQRQTTSQQPVSKHKWSRVHADGGSNGNTGTHDAEGEPVRVP
jgi:hypothetical protein